MSPALTHKLLPCPPLGGLEKQLARVAIKELNGLAGSTTAAAIAAHLLEKGGGLPISRVLGVMSIEIAYPIGRLAIAVPAQIVLDRHGGGSVRLFGHDGFVPHDTGRWEGLGGHTGCAKEGAEDGIAEAHCGNYQLKEKDDGRTVFWNQGSYILIRILDYRYLVLIDPYPTDWDWDPVTVDGRTNFKNNSDT